ncbi:hypothetical protein CTAM01_14188 [Colletotrichum tamarilloi]|uniref:Uncharacterized protein n=1 Tax=Colletotrichum tamarilloi TaxID=1209934 RepID=A0ABQ9QPZ2_9PEZI|nr:uncharacterized protein CTAM01_14188 [Colletotrichum tamarilloi]KAK1480903.1 hypothetical protein CTAM01_14188 [Colletotrichum tamarilloi]
MHQHPPAIQPTFDSQTQYNLQATEDIDEYHDELGKKNRPPPIPTRPDYRPKPLQWPFIVCMILVLSILVGLVIYAQNTMPNSDSTAVIEPRHYLDSRQESSSISEKSSSPSGSAQDLLSSDSGPSSGIQLSTIIQTSNADLPTTSGPGRSPASKSTSAAPVTISSSEKASIVAFVVSTQQEQSPTGRQEKAQVTTTTTSASGSEAQSPTVSSPPSSAPSDELPTGTTTATDDPNSVATSSSSPGTLRSNDVQSKEHNPTSGPTSSPSPGTTRFNDVQSKEVDSILSSPLTTRRPESSDKIKDITDSTVSGKEASLISSSGGSNHPKAPVTSAASSSSSSSLEPIGNDKVFSIIKSEFTSTVTRPGSTFQYTTSIVGSTLWSYSTTVETTIPGSTGENTYTRVITTATQRSVTRTLASSNVVMTTTIPVQTTQTDVISDDKTTYYQTTTKTIGRVTTSTSAAPASTIVEVTNEVGEATITSTAQFTSPARVSTYSSVVVSAVPTTIASVATSTAAGVVYVSVGTTEITKVVTIPGGSRGQQSEQPNPVTQLITSVFDGKVVTVVETGKPQVLVTNAGGVFTGVYTPPAETVETRIGGEETQMVVTVTPSLDVGLFAVQTTISGKPTVVLIQSTNAAGFKPVSLTLVSQIGGSTGVFTTTDAPEIIRTTIDGKETLTTRTPAPREFTSVIGGTPTTIAMVTTPTGSTPLSFTVITTIGGSLSTVISTPSPTTFVTSISGKLSTITSTPKPSTRVSTIGPSTAVFTSVSHPGSTSKPDTVITKVEKFAFTDGDYFLGKFLPVILAVMIAIPLRIIDLNAKLYQPFHALSQEGGALGKNSMTIQFEGWNGFLAPFKVLRQGHSVPFITTLMVWSSSLLAPLATEAIGMKLHGKCKITAIDGCGIQLGVSPKSSYILIALLVLIVALLLVLLYLLRSWKTGLHANPWSIGGISSLSLNAEIRPHHVKFKANERTMADKNYMLGFFKNRHGRDEYGFIYYDESADNLQSAGSGALSTDDESRIIKHPHDSANNDRKPNPFIALTNWWRIVFVCFLLALFIIILYYHVTLGLRTYFKDFMDSQTFGLRFFLAALGVIIIFCWESIFMSIAIVSPYYHLGRRSQRPESSILFTRPTNGFYGIYAAIINGDIALMLAAFMSITAEFLPMLLANVPYNLTQTLNSHKICSIISLTILALMIVAVGASLFIKWPEMPVDPRSIAGAMYYINESQMLDDFEGLSQLSSMDRKKKVGELGRRCFYGALTGKHGRRMGVDSVESVEDTVYTGANWLPPHDDSGDLDQETPPYQAPATVSLGRDPGPRHNIPYHEEGDWV